MGNYSEYRDRDPRSSAAIANKIIFTRQYPGKKLLSFLVVEGDTDRIFYTTFIDKQKCQVINAYNKSNALTVLSILERDQIPGILTIVDTDFDILEGKFPSSRNLLFTDTHDLETMIIKSPAFEKVLAVLGSEEKIDQIIQNTGKDVRTTLLECSIPVGYLRWISLQERLSLKFEGLDFAKFINRETLNIEQDKLIRGVLSKSQSPVPKDLEIKNRLQKISSNTHDPWHVCCGHDLVCILSIGLRKAIGTCDANAVEQDSLERNLRLAFEHSHFCKTQLYVSIQQWEKVNMPFVVLAPEQ